MYKALIIATLASLAVATPAPGKPSSQCNVGEVQCCNNVAKAGDPKVSGVLGLLNIVAQDVNVPIGLNCNPITIIGVSGSSCAAQPVCCDENNFNGLIAVGCTPINVNV